ncbi:hypothetical protein MCETHM1_00936 [Flavobacteriaceae bacterium]|jgi:hypothetical protein
MNWLKDAKWKKFCELLKVTLKTTKYNNNLTMELSKSDKKTARILMDKGILKEIEICNTKILDILTDWKNNKKDARETYGQVYGTVKDNDKYIASNYDGISGAYYFDTVLNMYIKGLISEKDINPFSETVRERLNSLKKNRF